MEAYGDLLLFLLCVVGGVGLLTLFITKFRLHPFIALLLMAFIVGVASGMPLLKIAASIQTGFGTTLGFIGIVLGLGTMIGKLLEESGGAERIARTLFELLGEKNIHWAMMLVAFIVGIPVFFQVGFVLLVPLVFTIARELKMSVIKIGLPMLSGLSVVHGVVPPHPAALASVGIFHADVGTTILYGLAVGFPSAIIAGPFFAGLISPKMRFIGVPERYAVIARSERSAAGLPGFGVTMATILSPVFLLLLATYADLFLDKTSAVFAFCKFLGHPVTALFLATLLSMVTFGFARGLSAAKILKSCDQSLLLIAGILLILGAGGALSQILVDSGIGATIGGFARRIDVNPILFAWLVATLIRVATGSATVAMITSAGIVAPVAATIPGTSPELMVLATGGGALMLSHVNDAGFWLVKEYFDMSLKETFLTWTVLETILGVSILLFTLLLSFFVV